MWIPTTIFRYPPLCHDLSTRIRRLKTPQKAERVALTVEILMTIQLVQIDILSKYCSKEKQRITKPLRLSPFFLAE
ncbi:hypothetical protein DYA88_05585 [Vibrio cholerae]|nr:hypothetical protein [Vibrio cholerae]ELJ8739081.1 hypothetical protein [Vibrio cholerae]